MVCSASRCLAAAAALLLAANLLYSSGRRTYVTPQPSPSAQGWHLPSDRLVGSKVEDGKVEAAVPLPAAARTAAVTATPVPVAALPSSSPPLRHWQRCGTAAIAEAPVDSAAGGPYPPCQNATLRTSRARRSPQARPCRPGCTQSHLPRCVATSPWAWRWVPQGLLDGFKARSARQCCQ